MVNDFSHMGELRSERDAQNHPTGGLFVKELIKIASFHKNLGGVFGSISSSSLFFEIQQKHDT